jgi:mannose-1-phosphate guanylyltransferase
VTRVILSTSYKAEVFEEYFGHGENFGIEIVYVTEESPLGTGGAIRNVARALKSAPEDPVIILNGDILSGHSIAQQVAFHQKHRADVTLHLIDVEDPRAYGLVPTDDNNRVLAFKEKPQTPEEVITHQINAGCYVFTRRVIDAIPADCVVSVERETFPQLLDANKVVMGYCENAYWLDLGTPLAFAQGSKDLVMGRCPSSLVESTGEAFILDSSNIDASAHVVGGTAIDQDVTIGAQALIDGSVIMQQATIGAESKVRDCIIGVGSSIGPNSVLNGVVVADGVTIGANVTLGHGVRVFPEDVIIDGTVLISDTH